MPPWASRRYDTWKLHGENPTDEKIMTLLYEQYLDHYQAAQRALSAKRNEEAKRELLLASRSLLSLAGETGDPALRETRKKRGLRLLELAGKLPETAQPTAGPKTSDKPADKPDAVLEAPPGDSDRWQVIEKPGVRFDDIAGLDAVKDLIRRRVVLPFKNPALAEQYRRKPGGGILMYGPPGTGKTMMAKAIATELDAPFYNVQSSEIMSKWVGEAEGNLKQLFQVARARLPSVVFFDETEALVAKRGGNSTVMNRLIPEFLAQVDGLKGGPGGLLLLGATNRPWDLDPASLRPGRFGEHIYVGLPDKPARHFMLRSTLGNIPCEADVDVDKLATDTEGFTGADLQGLVDRIIDPVFEQAMQEGRTIPIKAADVQRAISASRPSVSKRDLARYDKFRREGV